MYLHHLVSLLTVNNIFHGAYFRGFSATLRNTANFPTRENFSNELFFVRQGVLSSIFHGPNLHICFHHVRCYELFFVCFYMRFVKLYFFIMFLVFFNRQSNGESIYIVKLHSACSFRSKPKFLRQATNDGLKKANSI